MKSRSFFIAQAAAAVFASSGVFAATPVAQFRFEDAPGTIAASDINEINLNILAAPGGAAADLHGALGSGPGGAGRALNYSGNTAQQVNGPDTSTLNNATLGLGVVSQFTLAMWIKTDTMMAATLAPRFVNLGATGYADVTVANTLGIQAQNNAFDHDANPATPLQNRMAFFVNGGNTQINTGPQIANQTWTFVAAVYDQSINNGTWTIYRGSESALPTLVGGPVTAVTGGTVNFGAAGDMHIGNRQSNARSFDGFFDDVRFSTGTSELADIQSMFLSNLPATLYWDTDGSATAGGGGAAPSGDWNGTVVNFNTDSTGAASGLTTPVSTIASTVIFTAGSDGAGSYAVNVTGTRVAAAVQIARGDVSFTGGTIATATFNVATGASASVASAVAGGASGSITKTGNGTLTLSSANTYAGGTTVTAGTLVAGHEDALGTGALTINNSTTVRAQAGLAKALDVPSLAIAGDTMPTGTLDLTDGALVVRGATLATHTTITAQVRHAFNEFAWDQAGITSSTVATDVGNGAPTTLGILFNNDTGGNALFYGDGVDLPQFEGRSVDANTVLVKYTLLGDGNLDNDVNSVDFALFQAGFDGSAPYVGFAFGDYNYDGVVDSVDFGLFQAGFDASQMLQQQPELAAAIAEFAEAHGLPLGAAAVPEPASLGVLGLAACGMLARRWRA